MIKNTKNPNHPNLTPDFTVNPFVTTIVTASLCLFLLTFMPVEQSIKNISGILACFLLWIASILKPELAHKICALFINRK